MTGEAHSTTSTWQSGNATAAEGPRERISLRRRLWRRMPRILHELRVGLQLRPTIADTLVRFIPNHVAPFARAAI